MVKKKRISGKEVLKKLEGKIDKKLPWHMDYKVKRNLVVGFFVVLLVLLYTFKNFSFLIRVSSSVGFIVLFFVVDYLFKIHFEKRHYFFIFIIAVSGFLLSPLYFIYPSYDKILHFVSPILLSSVVFYMINKLDIEFKWKLLFLFFTIIGTLALFELGEYILDYLFDLKLQGVFLRDLQGLEKFEIILDRNDDTMIDVALGFFGAICYMAYRGFMQVIWKKR